MRGRELNSHPSKYVTLLMLVYFFCIFSPFYIISLILYLIFRHSVSFQSLCNSEKTTSYYRYSVMI